MRNRIFFFLTFILLSISTFAQARNMFEINEVLVDSNLVIKSRTDFVNKESQFYEDENYIVTKTCSGEWGGSIWFENKNTSTVFSCEATCPVSINKIGDNYIVTNSLAHLGGFSEVIEIENPDSLSIFKLPKPRKKKGNVIYRNFGDTESKSRKGVNEIWSEFNILILTSFIFENEIYHIASKEGKTHLYVIKNNKLEIIDLISNVRLWDYNPETFKMKNEGLIVFFKTYDFKGYIEILDNKINVTRVKN